MAITLMEGFKYLPSAASRYAAVNAASGTSTFSRVANRSGGYALRHSSSLTTDATGTAGGIKVGIGNTFSVGFATYHPVIYTGGANGTINGLLLTNTTATAGIGFTMHAGVPVVNANLGGGAFSGYSAPVYTDNTPTTVGWHWWNVVGIWGSPSAGYVRLYRDGVKIAEIAPDTTDSGGPMIMQQVIIYIGNSTSPATGGLSLCDLIVRNDTNLIPDTRVDVLAPTSDSAAGWTRSAGTTNFSLVDDAGPAVDTSDYVSSTTVGATDTYGMADLGHNPTSIYAVGVHAIGRKDASGGSRAAAAMVNSTEGAAMDTGSNGIVYNYWETNPSGDAAWTKADIDSMTAGIKIKT